MPSTKKQTIQKTVTGKEKKDLKKVKDVPRNRKTPPGFGSNITEDQQAWERGEGVECGRDTSRDE